MSKLFLRLTFLRSVAIATLVSFVATTVELPFLLSSRAYATSTLQTKAEPGVSQDPLVPQDEVRLDTAPPQETLEEPEAVPLEEAHPLQSVKHPRRLLLAKAASTVPLVPLSMASPGATELSAAFLEEAERLRDGKDYAGAVDAYFRAVEAAPNTTSGHVAVFSAIGMLKGIDETALDALEPGFPDAASLTTPEAKLLLGNYYQVRAKRARNAGNRDRALAYFGLTKSIAWDAMMRFPLNPVQVLAVDGFISAAEEEGPEALGDAMRQMESLVAQQGQNFTTWSCRLLLANYLPRYRRDVEAALHFAGMLDALDKGFVQSALQDPGVLPLVKGWVSYGLGMAFAHARDYEEAMAQYAQAMEFFPVESDELYHLAAFGQAYLTFMSSPNDLQPALDLFQKFMNYEGKAFKDYALLQIATIHTYRSEYHQALDVYGRLLQEYPKSPLCEQASQSIAYLQDHLLNTYEVAGAATDIVVAERPAQNCGPLALQRLLALQGLAATVEELAALAGTDEAGTTMLGLVEAAKVKGVVLTGLKATSLEKTPAPFIAHVDNGSHFVLVRDVSESFALVEDLAEVPEKVARDEFLARWDGLCLVVGEVPGQPALPLAQLKGAKGGWLPGFLDNFEIVCTKCGCKLRRKNNGQKDNGNSGSSGDAPQAGSSTPGTTGSPTASTAVSSPGVYPEIDTFKTSLELLVTDLEAPVRGGWSLSFARSYSNPEGFHRTTFQGTDKPWKNVIGDGWTHSYNVFLRTTSESPPAQVAFFDETGSYRYYVLDSSDSTYDYYYRSDTGGYQERGDVLKRNRQAGTYELTFSNGVTYEFSVPTTDSYYYARLERIVDSHGNQFVLTYDGGVGVGKLVKVAGPAGDVQHLAFTYTGNLITRVDLKKDTTVLQSVNFAYTNNELTLVTDANNNTVAYAYGSAPGVTNSRFISRITDKRGYYTDFLWSYTSGKAYSITVVTADGLETSYTRDLSTSICTIMNSDGVNYLSKHVNHPVPGNLSKSSRKDFYLDIATGVYESWLYEYTVDGNGYDVETVRTPMNGSGQHVVAGIEKYDSLGRLVSERLGASGPVTTYAYTGNNPDPTTVTDPAGIVTTYTYNAQGLVATVQHPSYGQNSYSYTYNSYGQITRETNPLGRHMDYAYDTVGNLSSITVDPGGLNLITSFQYDDFGNRTRITDPKGKHTYYAYGTGGCSACGIGQVTSVTDPLSNQTTFEYDANGNMLKMTDADSIARGFAYDSMNRLTSITEPSGSANVFTKQYNVLSQLTLQTDFEGKMTAFEYDYLGRLVQVKDANQTPAKTLTEVAFNYFGELATVTDGLNHTTTYAYNANFQLITATDAIGKQTRYFYDSAGRATKVGAGSTGSVDPTEYFYNATTGLLAKVRYTSGANYYDANYSYDAAGRLTGISDWLGGNGLQYTYDGADRPVTFTDYDNSALSYTYDANGNVTSMTDYHGNTTSYVYDDASRLSTLTAPGSKTWSYTYNGSGQTLAVGLPSGLSKINGLDGRGRLSSTFYSTGLCGITLERYDYTLDGNGNITAVDEFDGGGWAYGYDNRQRLTNATYTSPLNHQAKYAYTYNDGDNMVTKQVPFEEDFNDGNYTAWGASGTWSAANGQMANQGSASNSWFYRSRSVGDAEIRFSYLSEDTSSASRYIRTDLRVGASGRVTVQFAPTEVTIKEYDGSIWHTRASASLTTQQDKWYDVIAKLNGTTVVIERRPKDGQYEQVLTGTVNLTTSNLLQFYVPANAVFRVDDILVLDGTMQSTYSLAYNNANELTQMTNSAQGTTVSFTYDDWGRTATQTVGARSATYSYKYGSKLASVTSNLFGEQNVTFQYGGDQKRRSTATGGVTIGYNWDMGWNVINEEDGSGVLARSYTHDPQCPGRVTLGHVDGPNPQTGSYSFYLHDNLGSTRHVIDQGNNLLGSYQYTPYGELLTANNLNATTHLFTGHHWDAASGLYFAPYRFYSPQNARWLTRDPLGIVDGLDLYAYALRNPISYVDPMGLKRSCAQKFDSCMNFVKNYKEEATSATNLFYAQQTKQWQKDCLKVGAVASLAGWFVAWRAVKLWAKAFGAAAGLSLPGTANLCMSIARSSLDELKAQDLENIRKFAKNAEDGCRRRKERCECPGVSGNSH